MVSREMTSERLFFRPLRISDAPAVFDSYASDPEVVRYLTWRPYTSLEGVEAFLEEAELFWAQKTRFPWLLLHLKTGDLIGTIEMRPGGQTTELGFLIARPHWGQGYGTEAVKTVLEECFSDDKVQRVQALCDIENIGSAKVLAKAGMVHEGTLRSVGVHPNRSPEPRDAHIYSMIRRDLTERDSSGKSAEDFQPKLRFTDKVADYVRYRPSYPGELLTFLKEQCELRQGATIADVGAGTGILTRLLLDQGFQVHAVEPNDAMRDAMDDSIDAGGAFQSLGGSAENTSLAAESVDAITVAQAFHWFDPEKTRLEFKRILRPGSPVFLVWNSRQTDDPFNLAYEELVSRFGTDYRVTRMFNFTDDETLVQFYGCAPQKKSFKNTQVLDLDGLFGRLRSCSYIPGPDSPEFPALEKSARQLFERFEEDGKVTLTYNAELFWAVMQ
ncbi:MAG: GNAT family N-acetyltransferase [Planctomycetota bacterium]|nr:GNAT family N-acetyltransferase [Planctomycetota bacterium]